VTFGYLTAAKVSQLCSAILYACVGSNDNGDYRR